MTVDPRRIRRLNDRDVTNGPVVYWMSRDQRVNDNWALLYAQEVAIERRQPLAVAFCLVPTFLEATTRQYGFMFRGLEEVEEGLRALQIPFHLLRGDPGIEIVKFARRVRAGVLVTDFGPLRVSAVWKERVASTIPCAMHEVDAHNVVPCWVASGKLEFAAYTFRPKVHRLLPEFLTDFPEMQIHPIAWPQRHDPVDWAQADASLTVDRNVPEVDWIRAGEAEAQEAMAAFFASKIADYGQRRNDPTADGQSNLSPYLHFGQLSAQRVSLAAQGQDPSAPSVKAFLEELIVRRELSDNFCHYNPGYDSFEGFPDWARKSLNLHRADPRPYVYSRFEFEQARTHDDLWNAAQAEMLTTGKMHGYMRMYWAKKILEWTPSPEDAMSIAIYLNDRYELDGRDPNGYTGIAWSIGGVHDRAWAERPIFGKVRYMSYNGCKSKFDVRRYMASFL